MTTPRPDATCRCGHAYDRHHGVADSDFRGHVECMGQAGSDPCDCTGYAPTLPRPGFGDAVPEAKRQPSAAETGCDGLREALRRLIDAIETTGLHEHDDGRGGVDLCIPISGIRGVMNDACEAAGHEFLHPEDVPPFCRWCGAALAPTVAACAREGCGHEERHHRVDPDDIPWCWKDCPCPGYLTPSPATEAER